MKEEKNSDYYDDVYKKYKHYSLNIDARKNEIIDRFKNLFVEFNVYILDKIFIIDAKK